MRPMREARTLTLRFEARDGSAIETECMATEGDIPWKAFWIGTRIRAISCGYALVV